MKSTPESYGGFIMILKSTLQEYTKRSNVNWEIIQQDCMLSWILEGISKAA